MNGKIYMGGVCGMGMAPLAAFLVDDGADVSGFDDKPDKTVMESLRKYGVKFRQPENGEVFDEFIISTALKSRLDELRGKIRAKNALRRGEAWAKICSTRRLAAVVGSHGKSTVSAMLSHAVNRLSLDAGWLVGAVPHDFPMHRYCPESSIVISEIDESDATIENFSPEVTVALNADLDHIDTYADEKKLSEMFERLFARTKRSIVYKADDPILDSLAKKSGKHIVPVCETSDFVAANRAIASAALAEIFEKKFDENYAFENFSGLFRRQECIFNSAKIRVIADYAHHPNEVKTFLKWFTGKCSPADENIVVFQPHRYTRTRRFAQTFADILSETASLKNTKVYILPVYAASEPPDPLGQSSAVVSLSNSIAETSADDFPNIVRTAESSGKRINIAIVGAGDFYFQAKKFFQDNYEK